VVEEGVEGDGSGEGFGDGEVGEEDVCVGAEAAEGVEGCGEEVEVVGVAEFEGCVEFAIFRVFGGAEGVGVGAEANG
jgi:hypothetical protein